MPKVTLSPIAVFDDQQLIGRFSACYFIFMTPPGIMRKTQTPEKQQLIIRARFHQEREFLFKQILPIFADEAFEAE